MIGRREVYPVNTKVEETAAWDAAYRMREKYGCCVRVTEIETKPDPSGYGFPPRILGKEWLVEQVVE